MKKYVICLMVLMSILATGCREKPIGGETDEHGCMLMAGYTWCEGKQKCLRTWEEPCEAADFCDDEDVGNVFECDDYIKVVSKVPGAGSTYYRQDGSEVVCPVVAPDSMSEECRKLMFEPECEEKEIC